MFDAASISRSIKFAHTLFALPMAISGMLLATHGAYPGTRLLALILSSMVAGRSFAMAMNRLIDAGIDSRNPRTKDREIPSGRLSRRSLGLFAIASGILFLLFAGLINRTCLLLAPVALLLFVLYPFTKRFTALSHLFLGAVLGCAPIGAWLAVREDLDPLPLLLGLAVLCWVTGFDIIYALQDEAFDRSEGLHSIPAALGKKASRLVSRLLHASAIAAFAAVGFVAHLSLPYAIAVALAALLLALSHWLVRNDIERIHTAFFTVNSWLSTIVLTGLWIDLVAW